MSAKGCLFLSYFYPFTIFFVVRKNIHKQEASLKKIIVEGYRAVGSLNDSFQSSNFLLLLLLLFFIDFGQL